MDYTKELLKRFAQGKLAEFPESITTKDIEAILSKVVDFRESTGNIDVYSPLSKLYPEYLIVESTEFSNEELIKLCKEEFIKNQVNKYTSKFTKALTFNNQDPTFQWQDLAEEFSSSVHIDDRKQKRCIMAHELAGEPEGSVVASWGYPLWDHYLDGGITAGSYTILYAGSGVGKSTVGTANFIKQFVDQGKRVLVYYLEHNPRKFINKTLSQWCGFFSKDQKNYTREDYEAIKKSGVTFPIVFYGADKYRKMQTDIQTHQPDIIIFDQLTVASESREWVKMVELSSNLTKITREYGIPVIAITQSNLKNYKGADNKRKDGMQDQYGEAGEIKYAKGIFEDATTVLELRKYNYAHPMKRLVTVRKCKDDESATLNDLTFVMELNDNGIACVALADGDCEKTVTDLKIPATRKAPVVHKVEEVEESLQKQVDVVKTELDCENGQIDEAFATFGTNLFSDDTLRGLPDRFNHIAENCNDPVWSQIATTSKSLSIQYGDLDEPSYLISIESADKYGKPFKRFYNNQWT